MRTPGFSSLSLLCLAGYVAMVTVILFSTGSLGNIYGWLIASSGSFVLGNYYAACDRAEGRS